MAGEDEAMSAALALHAAEAAGVAVVLGANELLLEAPSAPPPLITEAVYRHRGEIANLLRHRHEHAHERLRREHVAVRASTRKRPPSNWAEALARLSITPKPVGFTPGQWDHILLDAERFVADWAEKAAAFGWTFSDVFGVHLRAPAARYDGTGLVLLLRGGRVVALDGRRAVTRMPTGAELTFLRSPNAAAIPIWHVAENPGDGGETDG
jgi:hypothetical protein